MPKNKKTSQNTSIETLQVNAAKLLAMGRYKEAIESYKRLLKKEQRDEWQTALAKAYLRRAQSLANKGMYKEAAVLWENRENLCTDKQSLDQYIYWLIRAGRYIRAVRFFTESAEYLTDNAIQQLQAQFGALLLAGCSDVMEEFPQDTPLLKQYALIRNALQAYFQGDSVELFLKKIPFRSPYRDFRPILKALLLIEVDPNAANQLLEKVPADSVYAQFAALVRIVGQDSETLLTTLSKLSAQEQLFIAGLKGWDKEQLNVISKLQTAAKRDGSPKALLEIASRNILGDNRQFCLALLPIYPAGVKFYEKKFGLLSAFEKNRITALNYERQEQSEMADRYWRLCVENLKPSSDNRLKAALILRHLVELAERTGEIFDDYQVPEDLAESLRLDPDDKASYLKLIQWYNHENDIKNYHKWVETAVKQFPQDSEVLLTAIESSTRKKAFKKAAAFAKALLKVDPINIKARQIARFSHISHARKLIKLGKYELARKELKQGTRFEKNKNSGIVQINQGLLELQAEGIIQPVTRKRSTRRKSKASESDLFELQQAKKYKLKNQKTIELLQEGFNSGGGALCGFFRIIVETKSQQLDLANILPLLPKLDKDYLPTQHEVLELLSLINAYSGVTFLTEAVAPLTTLLQKAAKLDFSQEEMLSICECFKKLEHHGLVRQFAENALKCWPEQPVFVYYQIYSQSHSKKRFWHISNSDMARLNHAADKAREQGDQRTAMMIVKFLNGMKPASFFNPFVMDDFEDDFESDIEALKNMDFDDLTPAEMIKLINHLKKLGIEIPDL
ncbi:hypothetical protein PN36_09760 [Candidatus Thiomargarita nelsonii]|uniref:Suppressor of forked domain-containing protein n=1 Tax=Candidatus Thiomargarita nelsonii TaxID=1003181 RepID=A0A0A6RTJ5_9GAMM|nr:hypothetical protein PN36_09760 [Candidatus Thiomargarita nelsonii]